MDKESIKMRVGFLKQLQHLKEMAHRKETAPNFTFLEVKFFSAEDGFDQDMTYLLNQRLEEARDEYNRRMIMLQKKNCEIKEKVEHFQQICADGNYGISFHDMGTESILRKLSIIENNPFIMWKTIEQYFGSGFFNDVILREYDIQTESSNEMTSEINYQLKEYQRKAKEHISSISKQTQIEVALLRKHLKDKEKQINDLKNKADEIAERVRTEERIETDLKLKQQEIMLKEKFQLEKEQISQTIARKMSSNSTVTSQVQADRITLKMAMTRWWFKGKLITIKRHDKAEREAIIEATENELHKQDIKQMAELQTTILELRQENYQLNKSVAEANYERNAMKRQFDKKNMESDQLDGELHTMRMQYKETLDERIQLQNTSASLLQSVDAQKAYIENMEKEMFDLEAWIKRACSVDKSLRPPKSLMSKSKQKHVADTLNKKAIKELFDSSVRELKQLESDNQRDKECLTLMHGLDAELDLVSEEQKIALNVETQTNLVYNVEESAQTSDELLSALKSKITPSVPQRQSSKTKQQDWKVKDVNELKEKHKKEIDKLKKEIESLRKHLKDETLLRIESSRSRDSEYSERMRLEELMKDQKQRRNTENYSNKGIFTKLDVPVSHQSSQTILEEDDEDPSPERKQKTRIRSPDRSPPNEKQANATSQTEESQGVFQGQPIFSEKQGKSKIIVNLTKLGLQEVTQNEDSKRLSEVSSPMEHVSSLLKAAEQEITVYEGSIEQSLTDVKFQSQAVGESIQQTIRTQQSPSELLQRYPSPSCSPVPPSVIYHQTNRFNVSKKEQRPVFKVIPYNLEVFERFLERQKPELAERGVQTSVAGSLQKKLVVDKSGTSLLEEMMNTGLRKSIDLREISRNRQSKSKLSTQYQSNNTRSAKSIKTPLNKAMEDVRIKSPSPVDSSPLNISHFITAITPDQQQLSPKMFMTPKTADSTTFMQTPMSTVRPDSGRPQGQNFITVSEHQKIRSKSNLRAEQGPRHSASYSLTNMSLQTISIEDPKKQDYTEKRKENMRRFNYHIKKSFMLQRQKQKSLGSPQEVSTLREKLKNKNKQFKTVIANEGRKFVMQDDQQQTQPQQQQRAISSFSPAYMVPLYRNEGSTSVESTRDMLLLDSNRSSNSKRFHKTIKFESPPIVQPLQLSEVGADSEVQISVDRD